MSDSKSQRDGSADNIVIKNIEAIENEIQKMQRDGTNSSDALTNGNVGLYIYKLNTLEYQEFRKKEGVYHSIPDNPDFVAIELV
jgi:hypothetical protein